MAQLAIHFVALMISLQFFAWSILAQCMYMLSWLLSLKRLFTLPGRSISIGGSLPLI